jgi:hypothetical protein
MGWLSDKQIETATRLRARLEPSVSGGETLRGAVYATKRSTFSNKLYAVGVTEQHLLMQEVDRKWNPVGEPIVATTGEVKVGNIFSEGAKWSLTDKDLEIRFEAKGQDYRLSVLGGTMLEDALAGSEQLDGLQALAAFLRTPPR